MAGKFAQAWGLLFVAIAYAGASSFTLDDIDFWVGEGENHAGLVLDWNGDNESLSGAAPTLSGAAPTPSGAAPTLAWGFRWDGTATADDALRSILAADRRLFGKLPTIGSDMGDEQPLGTRVLGLGYDANDDGQFAIEPDPLLGLAPDPGFDANTGLAFDTNETFASSVDPSDAYEEGFDNNLLNPANEGFWHFAVAFGGAAENWISSPVGVSGSTLIDGEFLGFSFTPTFDFTAFPDNIVAAEPPSMIDGLPGDFNGDLLVDAADYTILRDTGADAESLAAFQANFGATASPASVGTFSIPEPNTAALLQLSLITLVAARWRCVAIDQPHDPFLK